MSEKQEKRARYNERLAYIAAFDRWLDSEPRMVLFWRWLRWKRSRPVRRDVEA